MARMSQEDKEKYFPKNLPKIKNYPLYFYRCFLKVFFIVFFGAGAVFLAIFVFPFIRLFSLGSKKDFGIIAREYVSHTFRNFLHALQISGGTKKLVEPDVDYRDIHSKILVANHPSLLDFVYIMSMVPNSTCIVRGTLTHTPLIGVIKQAYITNTTDFESMCVECKKVTDKGCNVIIFPEGTRTPRNCRNTYKKGAARIALYCNCDVQPIFIGGSDKYGLGKHDKLLSFNPVERYVYDFKKLPVISVAEFKDQPEPIAAKHLTERIEQEILAAAEEHQKNHSTKTINNV